MTSRFVQVAKTVIAVSQEHENDRCAACNVTRYEHRDHAHVASVAERRVCPFGDCDEFV